MREADLICPLISREMPTLNSVSAEKEFDGNLHFPAFLAFRRLGEDSERCLHNHLCSEQVHKLAGSYLWVQLAQSSVGYLFFKVFGERTNGSCWSQLIEDPGKFRKLSPLHGERAAQGDGLFRQHKIQHELSKGS